MSECIGWYETDLDNSILWIYLMIWLVQSIILISAKSMFLVIPVLVYVETSISTFLWLIIMGFELYDIEQTTSHSHHSSGLRRSVLFSFFCLIATNMCCYGTAIQAHGLYSLFALPLYQMLIKSPTKRVN